MRFKKYISVLCCMILLGMTACKKTNDYLDKAESGGITDEELFRDYVQTDAFLANIYATGISAGDWMPVYSFTYAAACDEAKCQNFSSLHWRRCRIRIQVHRFCR